MAASGGALLLGQRVFLFCFVLSQEMKLLLKNVFPCQSNYHLVSFCWLVMQAAPSGIGMRALPSGLPASILNEISWIYFHSVMAYGRASTTRAADSTVEQDEQLLKPEGRTFDLLVGTHLVGVWHRSFEKLVKALQAFPIEITDVQNASCNGKRLPSLLHLPGVCVQNACFCEW